MKPKLTPEVRRYFQSISSKPRKTKGTEEARRRGKKAALARWMKDHPSPRSPYSRPRLTEEQKHANYLVSHAQWRASNKEAQRAHFEVNKLIRQGKLIRQPCEVCGNPRSHAHHDDYSKPTEIKWFCAKHHGEYKRNSHIIEQIGLDTA